MKNLPIIYIILVLIIILAAFLRLYNMPDRPFTHDLWLWTIGLNLHKTPFLNFDAHVTENFFKSLSYTPHGWTDTLPIYIASGIYNILKIPLNEYWIYFMHAFLGISSVFLIFVLGRILFNPLVGLLSAAIFAILPIELTVHGASLMENYDFLIFLQLLLFLSLVYYRNVKSLFSSVLFSFILFLNAGTENFLVLPAIFIFQYVLEYEKEKAFIPSVKSFFKDILNLKYLLIWIPTFLVLFLHIYIYYRIGMSNLGMIGYVFSKWGTDSSSQVFLSMAQNIFKMIYDNFFGVYFISVIFLCILYFFNKKHRINMKLVGLVFWFLSVFFVNAYFKQGENIITFRYAHFFVPLILVSAYVTTYVFEYLRGLKISNMLKRYLGIFLLSSFLALFFYNTAIDLKIVLSRKVYSNPLKAVSFYTREHGDEETTIFQLISNRSRRNWWGEYYFGKPYMEPGDETGIKRQLFCFGEHAIDEYKKAYNLKDFDFYIVYHDEIYNNEIKAKILRFLDSVPKRRLKKVADIEKNGLKFATIYSPHPLAYRTIDADLADRLWDKKYANLKNLLQNRWCGLTILWGYHHRIK